jgi:hypothetical protein
VFTSISLKISGLKLKRVQEVGRMERMIDQLKKRRGKRAKKVEEVKVEVEVKVKVKVKGRKGVIEKKMEEKEEEIEAIEMIVEAITVLKCKK